MQHIPMRLRLWLAVSAAITAAGGASLAGVPEIYSVTPGNMHLGFAKYEGAPHRIITGANFDTDGIEVWSWAPHAEDLDRALLRHGREIDPLDSDDWLRSLEDARAGADFRLEEKQGRKDSPGRIPAEPPTDRMRSPQGEARRVPDHHIWHRRADMLIVDVPLGHVVWIRNHAGWSAPYALDVAQAFYAAPRRVRQEDHFRVVGLSVGSIGLRGEAQAWILPAMAAPREGWGADPFVRYARLPADVPPGVFEVFTLRGGGVYGWQPVGNIEVIPRGKPARTSVAAAAHGVRADGLSDDTVALQQAMAAAGKGGEVRLPFGVLRVTRTLNVPDGLRLIGAGQSIIRGDGFDPYSGQSPGPVIRLSAGTELNDVTVEGAVPGAEGIPAALVVVEASATDVAMLHCRFDAVPESPGTFAPAYRYAVYGKGCKRVRLAQSEINGAVAFLAVEEVELVRNSIYEANRNGAALAMTGRHCLVDSNKFRIASGQLRLHPLVQSVVRYNQIHHPWRGNWATASTDTGLPPDSLRRLAAATGGDETTLVDTAADWEPGVLENAVVLILEGKGFGQARRVTGNTADTLTTDAPWRVPPDTTSRYLVGRMSFQTVFSYNYHDAAVPWIVRDAVACLFRAHYMVGAPRFEIRGEDRTSADTPHDFRPSWNNAMTAGFMQSCAIVISGRVRDGNRIQAPPTFGTVSVNGQYFDAPPAARPDGFASRTISVHVSASATPPDRAAVDATVITGAAQWTDVGVAVDPGVGVTVIPGMHFSRTAVPVDHRGDVFAHGPRLVLGSGEFDPDARTIETDRNTWPIPDNW